MNRWISHQITWLISKTPLTPNSVTSLGLLAGIGAGVCMAHGTHDGLLWGVGWLHVSFILDNCDGELARLKSLQSRFGGMYDLVADVLVDYAVWMGLASGMVTLTQGIHWIAWGVAACLGSTINLGMVIWEKKKGCSTSVHSDYVLKKERKQNMFLWILDFLSHNGDVILLAWIAAWWGQPAVFLICGCVYIHLIWIGRFLSHRKELLA